MSDITERRRLARANLLGEPTTFKSIGVEVKGLFYAVREPTVGERAAINKAATGDTLSTGKPDFDLGNHQMAGMLACVFVGTAVLDGDGKPEIDQLPDLDANGEPILDAAGQPKTKPHPRVLSGFTPEERVFEQGDLKKLIGQPVSSFVNAFLPIVQRLQNPTKEDAYKSVG